MSPSARSVNSMRRTFRAAVAIAAAAFVVTAAMPAGVAQTPVLDITIQNQLSADFNDDAGGFAASVVPPPPPRPAPANPSWDHGQISRPILNPSWEWGQFVNGVRPAPQASTWQWGAPTSGPGVAASGSNVWATNLAGLYNNNECGAIMSPPITIPAGSTASASFMQWRHFERSSTTGTIWDAGRMFVTSNDGSTLTSITAPTPAYDTGSLSSTTAACLDAIATTSGGYAGPVGTTIPGPAYSQVGFDLSAFAGQSVRVLIAFGSEGSGQRDGWYIDDFAVTIDGVTSVQDFESSDGGFSIVSTAKPQANGPGVAYSGVKAWGTNLAGHHNANECSAIMSPPISIPTGSTASVSFMQWRHFQRTSTTGTIFDAGRVFVTTNGGQTLLNYTTPSPAYDVGALSTVAAACLDGMGTTGSNAYGGPVGTTLPPATYSAISANLNAYAGQTVQFIIAFASDATTQQSGWYIDDFAVTIDGVTTVENFESSDGGFTLVATKPSGPGVAYSGNNVWATNLAGDHNNNECAALMSPPITVPIDGTASFSFQQWRHFERATATGTISDAGRLFVTADEGESFISVDAPTPAYDAGSILSTVATCFNGMGTTSVGAYGGPVGTTQPAPVYSQIGADLSAYAGSTVRAVLAFGSSASTVRNGWYIDDFAVTINGTTSVQDFESGDGGFTVVSTQVPPAQAKGWSHGAPTTGPAVSAGDQLWATNLNGNHGPNECHWIESAPLDLGPLPVEADVVAVATLAWDQWFRAGTSTAAGVVQIGTADGNYTIVAPTGGYYASPTSTVLDACLGHLSAGLGAFAGLRDPVGGPLTTFEADISEFLGQVVTVRFLFASTSSTVTNPGWYVDNVNVEVALVVEAPSLEDLPIPGLGGADAPGWTSGGNKSTWAYGVTTTNPANQTTYKTNLNGNHDANECSYIESPAIPGPIVAGAPTLSFEHWHRIAGVSVNVPWAAGIVLVSGDNGATWQHLAMPDYNKNVYESPSYTEIYDLCLGAMGADIAGGGYGMASTSVPGNVGGWYTSTGDLSAYAGAPAVKVRFAFASDGSFAYEGWAIRAVSIGGVKVL